MSDKSAFMLALLCVVAEYGNERSVSLSNKSCSEVSDALQTLVKMDT